MDFAAIGPINSTKSSRLLNVVEDIYPGGGVCHPRRQDGQRMRKRQKNDQEEHVVFVINNQHMKNIYYNRELRRLV